jgi:predicted O-methyltransferase YrrM
MIMHLGLEITEPELAKMLGSLSPFSVNVVPPGIALYRILEGLHREKPGPIRIVETGCVRDSNPTSMMSDGWSTFYFAKWVAEHPGSSLATIDIDQINIDHCKLFLKRFGLEKNPTFITGDSVETLNSWSHGHIDVLYLDSSDDQNHGLEEFKAGYYRNPKPKVIIMDDFVSKAAKAVEFASRHGIPFGSIERYTFFKPD